MRRADFQRVYNSGRRFNVPFFTAFAAPTPAPGCGSRVGFTTPRALGKAVLRNRARRRVREAVRQHFAELGGGWDVVFNPKRAALQAPFPEMAAEVRRYFEGLRKQG